MPRAPQSLEGEKWSYDTIKLQELASQLLVLESDVLLPGPETQLPVSSGVQASETQSYMG